MQTVCVCVRAELVASGKRESGAKEGGWLLTYWSLTRAIVPRVLAAEDDAAAAPEFVLDRFAGGASAGMAALARRRKSSLSRAMMYAYGSGGAPPWACSFY